MQKRVINQIQTLVRSVGHMNYRRHFGAVLVEFAVTAIILVTIIAYIWRMLAVADFRQGVYSAVYTAFNDHRLRLFTRENDGDTARWDDSNVDVGVLNKARAEFQNHVLTGSGYTHFASTVLCEVRLGYLQLSNGVGTNSFELHTSPGSPPGDLGIVVNLLNASAAHYAAQMNGRFLLPYEARINTDPEYQAPYIDSGATIDPSSAPPAQQIYFSWHAFFAWGCLMRRKIMLFDLSEQYSGVFVPNKTLS